MTNQCACSRPVEGAFLCDYCVGELSQALAEVPFLMRQLEVVITRQAVHAPAGDGSRSAVKPLPFHVAAAETSRRLGRVLEQRSKELIVDRCPASARPEHTALFLLGQVTTIAAREDGPKIHLQITKLVDKARWLIDRPPDRWYAGPCNNEIDDGRDGLEECGVELYAQTGAAIVKCKACDAQYDVKARRDYLLRAAEDHLANAATVARAVSWLGTEPVTPARIAMWVKRKRLHSKGSEPYGDSKHPDRTRPLYRVGDVIDLLAETASREKS